MTPPIRISSPPTPAQVAKIIAARKAEPTGEIVEHHPYARGRRVGELKQALGRAGVPHRLVQTLGWTTTGAKPKPAQVEATEPEDTTTDGDIAGSD